MTELGQFANYPNSISEYYCPNFIEAGFMLLAYEIERVEWNINQESYLCPTSNNGQYYHTDVFEIRAFVWCCCDYDSFDENCNCNLPNFKIGDFEVRWYKRMGRGMSMNKDINANEFFKLIDKCLECVLKKEIDHELLS